MRRALILGIVFFTIFSTLTASASSLMINGGTIQRFFYKVNVSLPKSQPMQKRKKSRPPESRIVPESSIGFADLCVQCNGEKTIQLSIINTSTEVLHESSWELYLDSMSIQEELLPSIQAQDVYTITVGISHPGIYQFRLSENVAQNSTISNLSEEIIVNENNCPNLFIGLATVTLHSFEVTVELRNQTTPTPFSPLSTPSPDLNTATVQPTPNTIPQASPTQAVPTQIQTDEITTTISPTVTNSPGVSEDTSAVDPTQTQTMISSSP